ncbi:transglutaminaseTgpA domain-containing protein [Nocardioides insulae]|uniref:transglutaminase family protein n=1 Tax=Nocardioides insulae TaxID=394734 RepID=UPI0003F9600E|nr:DUF3488 and transglutaminase-like domain-containing protein [Nocardioides insulae]
MTRAQAITFSTLLSFAAAGTVWLSTFSWQAFTYQSRYYLVPMLLIGLVVASTGSLVRSLRGGPWLTFAAQLVIGGAVTSRLVGGSFIPYGDGWDDLTAAVERAADTAMGLAPPVPAGGEDGLAPILLLCGFGCMLVVDLVAVGLGHPSVAGLPLLAVVSVPFGISGLGVTWWTFAATVFGFLTLIGLHENERVARWGRPLDDGERLPRPQRGAAVVAGSATALAVIVPASFPALEIRLFDLGPGAGSGDDITVSNPLVSMREDLVQGPDVRAVTVTTDDPRPDYLRLAVLTRFSNEEWSAGTRNVPGDQVARGTLPPLQGVGETIPLEDSRYRVDVAQSFHSTWLPTQPQLRRIDADGDWRYDITTMDFIAANDDLSTGGMSYSFTALEPQLSSSDLEDAQSGASSVDPGYREVPDDVPQSVEQLAFEVTDGSQSSFERAVALQRWFRVGGGFTYSTDVDLGSGPSDLAAFLEEDNRRGFCQQFATAMAVMARELGIPARVAIGFLTPEKIGSSTYEYSTHDLHAWPELYFAGFGWVAFEPTPSARAPRVPAYTRGLLTSQEPASPDNSAAPLPQTEPDRGGQPAPEPGAAPVEDEDGADGFPWGDALLILALAATVVGLAAVPTVVRRRRRSRRIDGAPEDLWAELRDTVIDLGLPWPAGLSPRATGRVLHRYLTTREARTALDRIIADLETTRYSPRSVPGPPTAELAAVIADLRESSSRRVRRRADWWPRSVLGLTPTGTDRPGNAEFHPTMMGAEDDEDVVEHVR